jgi:hypothetical protein
MAARPAELPVAPAPPVRPQLHASVAPRHGGRR